MKFKKIKDVVEEIIEPSIKFIKRSRNRGTMPFKDIEKIIKIFFPKNPNSARVR
ncbi:MAG: hypothetical protein KKG87_00535 [Elusimicrobia bacterium]|nr:hypothetical protein [Elusimicrobiota bacterium]